MFKAALKARDEGKPDPDSGGLKPEGYAMQPKRDDAVEHIRPNGGRVTSGRPEGGPPQGRPRPTEAAARPVQVNFFAKAVAARASTVDATSTVGSPSLAAARGTPVGAGTFVGKEEAREPEPKSVKFEEPSNEDSTRKATKSVRSPDTGKLCSLQTIQMQGECNPG